jgi:hypothetical protein
MSKWELASALDYSSLICSLSIPLFPSPSTLRQVPTASYLKPAPPNWSQKFD